VSSSNSSSGGIGFTGLLTITFIVLKLCKVIDWSWWWVLSPIWIIVLLIGTFGIIYLTLTLGIPLIRLLIREQRSRGNSATYKNKK
jgi:hypothetical protein